MKLWSQAHSAVLRTPEEDEHESEVESNMGTERRSSYAGTGRRSSYAPTSRKTSYAETCTDSMCSGVTESVASTDRRTSGMSTGTVAVSTVDGHEDAAVSTIVDDDRSYVSGEESDEDDARTARGDNDEDQEEEAKDPETDDEYEEAHDAADRTISDTASVVEVEVMKMLEPAGDSALGTESAVSAA